MRRFLDPVWKQAPPYGENIFKEQRMCWYCGSPLTESEPIGRGLSCPQCGKDLRVCRHCQFFKDGSFDCAESGAEPVADKEKANFCEWFALDRKFRSPRDSAKSADQARSAKEKFDTLFS
jgi:predicted RNA-binding Zn-ribbon protein involved in translation (DUF1610 family)